MLTYLRKTNTFISSDEVYKFKEYQGNTLQKHPMTLWRSKNHFGGDDRKVWVILSPNYFHYLLVRNSVSNRMKPSMYSQVGSTMFAETMTSRFLSCNSIKGFFRTVKLSESLELCEIYILGDIYNENIDHSFRGVLL